MSEDNSAFTVTLKGGAGYDASWVVIRGNTAEEVTEQLRNLGDLPAAVVEAASLLQAAGNLAPIAHAGPAQAPAQAPQQQQAWGGGQQQPQQQGGGRSFAPQHPEGKQCEVCGQVLEAAQTRTGKKQWKCSNYRWNNGNPNGHTLEWVNG